MRLYVHAEKKNVIEALTSRIFVLTEMGPLFDAQNLLQHV